MPLPTFQMSVFSKIPHSGKSFLFLHFIPQWFHLQSCITHTIVPFSKLMYSNAYWTDTSIYMFQKHKTTNSKGELIAYNLRPLEVHISVNDTIILCQLASKQPFSLSFFSASIPYIYIYSSENYYNIWTIKIVWSAS